VNYEAGRYDVVENVWELIVAEALQLGCKSIVAEVLQLGCKSTVAEALQLGCKSIVAEVLQLGCKSIVAEAMQLLQLSQGIHDADMSMFVLPLLQTSKYN
jgi:hypothetical protein